MRTSVEDIYAVGDAVEVADFLTGAPAFVPLAGPANRQGRIAADNICGIDSRYTGTQGSAVLKLFDMTVATTGLNEKTAAAAGVDYDKTYLYLGAHAGYYPGGANMSIRLCGIKSPSGCWAHRSSASTAWTSEWTCWPPPSGWGRRSQT